MGRYRGDMGRYGEVEGELDLVDRGRREGEGRGGAEAQLLG